MKAVNMLRKEVGRGSAWKKESPIGFTSVEFTAPPVLYTTHLYFQTLALFMLWSRYRHSMFEICFHSRNPCR